MFNEVEELEDVLTPGWDVCCLIQRLITFLLFDFKCRLSKCLHYVWYNINGLYFYFLFNSCVLPESE